MNFDQITFHQLKVFLSLYKTRSASKAAEEMKVTNSSITRTISSLRNAFDDKLFVRTNKGFELTDKAMKLGPYIEQLVADCRGLDKEFSGFIPAESDSRFEILAYDEFSFATQKVIREDILPEAPRMVFNVKILNSDCVPDIVSGRVDFAVVYEGFYDKRLNFECFAHTKDIYLLFRKGHPLDGKKDFSVEELSKYKVLEIDNYSDLACPLLVDVCRQAGDLMGVSGYTESVASAFQILSQTDSVTVVCNQFTLDFADKVSSLSYIKLPRRILERIREMRSQVRPIGNYVAYGGSDHSQAFLYVKEKLVSGLRRRWEEASSHRP
ncbi:MAG: LysR family transcriptional regulator [Sutterellaceae bacterium]|nr:LysR family transcriptional regulator [Sutterellaceae bacterium]MDY2867543.1 LysR family transcriptional regulator [Mesosutterella sp.]